jgi:hypothetical protein
LGLPVSQTQCWDNALELDTGNNNQLTIHGCVLILFHTMLLADKTSLNDLIISVAIFIVAEKNKLA